MKWFSEFSLLVLALISCSFGINAQSRLERICTTSKFEDACNQLQRGNPEVGCIRVQDSIDCAEQIRNGDADFGVFTAENALHITALGWDGLTVIKELRHIERLSESSDFQSVVLVPVDFTGGIGGLRGMSFCHPGYFYDKTQRWTEFFLKYFERTVSSPVCTEDGVSPAEIETTALARQFPSGCRPGLWSNNLKEDVELKSKFPGLCSLCTSDSNECAYPASTKSGHYQALECLSNPNTVTYVSLLETTNYFAQNPDLVHNYAYLCPNGTKQTVSDNVSPCVWLRQPWGVIIASSAKSIDLSARLNNWMNTIGGSSWQNGLREIIQTDSYAPINVAIQLPADYIRPFRTIPVLAADNDMCSTKVTWCTTSLQEKQKCEVVRAAGLSTGVYPLIECRDQPIGGVVSCLKDISEHFADFMGIDSNFGYLARQNFNLTAAVYAETEYERYASVVAIIHDKSYFKTFEDLRSSKACFPEFGGIAQVAFVNVGKGRGFFDKDNCNNGEILNGFFGDSCLPGSQDELHSDPSNETPDTLCNLCRTAIRPAIVLDEISERANFEDEASCMDDESQTTTEAEFIAPRAINNTNNAHTNCLADTTNRFYSNTGALNCLNEMGDVAIIELQNLSEHALAAGIDENQFRIICRNGSLAAYTGFKVDEACALTTIVDGEVVVRRQSKKTAGIVNALLSFDQYFQSDLDFKMYNIYNGTRHLLFKDSTIGLASADEVNLGPHVENYIKLFDNIERCVDPQGRNSATFITVNILLMAFLALFTLRA